MTTQFKIETRLQTENYWLKNENKTLKTENEALKAENTALKLQNDNFRKALEGLTIYCQKEFDETAIIIGYVRMKQSIQDMFIEQRQALKQQQLGFNNVTLQGKGRSIPLSIGECLELLQERDDDESEESYKEDEIEQTSQQLKQLQLDGKTSEEIIEQIFKKYD